MKKIFEILFIFSIGVFILTSCEQDINEYTLEDLGAAAATPGAAVVDTVAETYCAIIVTPSEIGARTYYFMIEDGVEIPDVNEVVTGNADMVASGYFEPEALENDTFTINELEMETTFNIYTFAVSEAGVASAYSAAVSIKTFDETIPYVSGFNPAKGAIVSIDQNIVLTFNESVTYDTTKAIVLFSDYASYNEVVSKANILIEDNVVTILHTDWPYEDYINLTMEEGAFVDDYDNVSAAIVGYPGSPNYWFETGLPPASEFVGNWTCSETSLYGGTASYAVTITAGEEANQLVITSLWGVFGAVIPTVIVLDQETGNVTCPVQYTGYTYGGDLIFASYSNAWSLEDGVYGGYYTGYIYFDAKLYASNTGIFDQVQFELTPSKSKAESRTVLNKELEVAGVDKIKEKF